MEKALWILLDAEFSWIKEGLLIADPVLGPHLFKLTRW